MGNTANDSIREEEYAERKALVCRLRTVERMSWEAIGERVGLHKSTVRNVFDSAMRERSKAEAALSRSVEEEKLDALEEALWAIAATRPEPGEGDDAELFAARYDAFFKAHDRVLKIIERRCRMLGLDMPSKTEVTGKDGSPVVVSLDQLTALMTTAKANEKDDAAEPAVGAGEPGPR